MAGQRPFITKQYFVLHNTILCIYVCIVNYRASPKKTESTKR